jgi:hypothetical protein
MKIVSAELKDLISKILQPETTRYSLDQILNHTWMKSNLAKSDLRVNFSKLKQFSKYHQLQKFTVNLVATQLTGK